MKTLKTALGMALLAAGTAASAQSAGDLQCIVVSNAYASQAKDERAKKIAEASVYFYLGRIANSMTAAQLKTALEAQAKTLTDQSAPGIMNNCASAIQAKVKMLESMAAPAAKPATTPKTTQPGR